MPESPQQTLVLPSWEDVQDQFRTEFPTADPSALRERWNQHRELSVQRERYRNAEEEGWAWWARRAIPFGSAAANAARAVAYGRAQQRFSAGNPEPGDPELMAAYERLLQLDHSQSLGGETASGLAQIPALLGEGVVGGRLLGLGARAATPAAEAAPSLAGSLAGRAVTAPFRAAPLAATMPSMYLEGATQRNMAAGRDPMDIRGFPPALALASMQTAVLGSLGGFANDVPGTSLRAYLQRLGTRTATGMGEQAAVDVLASAAGLESGYGLVGDLFEGRGRDALRRATVQAVTFAAFAGLHEAHGRDAVRDRFLETTRALRREGMSAERAGRAVEALHTELGRELADNPNLTRAEAIDLFAAMPEGPLRRYAMELADRVAVPEVRHLEAAGPEPGIERSTPEPPRAPERVEPMTPEQASGALAVELRRQEAASQGAAPLRSEAEQARLEQRAPETPVSPERPAWQNTGTAFREQGERVEFSGKDGRVYDIVHEYWEPGSRESSPLGGARVAVRDAKGNEVARVGFYRNPDGTWTGEGVRVNEGYRGSGAARAMYDYMLALGERVTPSPTQTPEGKEFWAKNQGQKQPQTEAVSPPTPQPARPDRLEAMRQRQRQQAPQPPVAQPPSAPTQRERHQEARAAAEREELRTLTPGQRRAAAENLLLRAGEQARDQRRRKAILEGEAPAEPAEVPQKGEPPDAWKDRVLRYRAERFRQVTGDVLADPTSEGAMALAEVVGRMGRMAEARGLDPHELIARELPDLVSHLGEGTVREILQTAREFHNDIESATTQAQRVGRLPASVRRLVAERLQVGAETPGHPAAGEGSPPAEGPAAPEGRGPAAPEAPHGEPAAPAPEPARGGKAPGNKLRRWKKPDLATEHEEIQRAAQDTGLSEESIRSALSRGRLVPLPEEASHLLRPPPPGMEGQMDYQRIARGIAEGATLPAPIVLRLPDGSYHLIAGGTRLAVSAAQGLRPDVLLAEIKGTPPRTILAQVKRMGGISRENARLHGIDIKMAEEAIPSIFRNQQGRKGTRDLAELAEELQQQGHLVVPEGRHPHDFLIEQITQRATLMDRGLEAQLAREQEAYEREKAEAAAAGYGPEAIARATAEGRANGEAEGRHESAEAVHRELVGEAHEPPGALPGGEQEVAPGVFFYEGAPPQPGAAGGAAPGRGVGPFEIIQTAESLLGPKRYVEKNVPYRSGASAAYLQDPRAIVTGKMAAGNAAIDIHERAHDIATRYNLETNPLALPERVAEGLRQFDYDPDRPLTRRAIMEGFAEWLRLRETDGLRDLTAEQQEANRYAEDFIGRQEGLTSSLDRLREMFRSVQGQSAAEQAAGLLSATGQPAEPALTTGERTRGVWQRITDWWTDNVTDSLGALRRMQADAAKKGFKAGTGEDAATVWSRLMFADKSTAGEFETKGVWTIMDGKKTTIGLPVEKILEPLRPEDLAPFHGELSRFDVYAIGRHILQEARRERPVVPEDQRQIYQRAMQEFAKDREFMLRAKAAADNLTRAFNSTLDALAAPEVHYLSPELAQRLKEERPTYVPTERVLTDAGWQSKTGAGRGEQMRALIKERSGSGEQIVSPLVSYKKRLSLTAALLNEQLRRNAVAQYLLQPGMGEWGLVGPQKEVPTEMGLRLAETYRQLGLSDKDVATMLRQLGDGATYFTNEPWPTDGTKPTYWWKGPDGKATNFRIGDRALYDLITGQQATDPRTFAGLLRAVAEFLPFTTPWGERSSLLKFPAQLVRKGATALSLGFQIRNIVPTRDPKEFLANTIDRASVGQLPEAYRRAYAFEWAQLWRKESSDTLFRMFHELRGEDLRQFAFDRSKPEAIYGQVREPGQAVEAFRGTARVVKDALSFLGAGELGPRFLEFRNFLNKAGYPEARVSEMAARGENVPFFILQGAMEAAAEVTVPFGRGGVITREINKLVPFFQPALAGAAKALRNVRENPRGAMIALGTVMGLRLLHWLAFRDEEWYREQSAHDRFANFVVPVGGRLYRLPGSRDLDVPAGGALITVLDAATRNRPDLPGLVAESIGAIAPPAPVPTPASIGVQLLRNRNWMGSPIVPRRDEHLPAMEQALTYQAPYAIQQLTGGRGELSLRGAGVVPFTEVRNARRSLDEFYDRLHALEAERTSVRRSGRAFPQEREYQILHQTQTAIQRLGLAANPVRGQAPSQERQQELRQRQLQLARTALQALAR